LKDLLLLHGALGAGSQFEKLSGLLKGSFNLHTMNFSGHGGKPVPEEPFSIKMFAGDILTWLDENKIDKINIFGYSMGGYAAMYLAKNHPGKVGRIFTLATKLEWTEEIAAKEVKMLDAGKIKEKVPKFAEELRIRHSPQDWEAVLSKTSEMMVNLGRKNVLNAEDYSMIENQVQIGIGDRDKMATLEESINAYRKLKNGKLLVLPNTPHPLEHVDAERLSYEIKSFFG
jgi:pimeloyl-ACP methyl ester carboxylesterase